MFSATAYENSRPGGVGVLEIVDGGGPAAGEEGGERATGEARVRRFVPLKRTELRGEIMGPLAALRLTQRYGYSKAQCDRVLEAVYRFPLPGDAAVMGVRVRFGEVEIRAELKERQEAEATYEAARQEGRQAALLTRESPDVFTLQVAGIAPDQDVVVETRYVQLARADGAGWTLRVPLTTAPRYVRRDELTSRHAQGQPLFLLRDPGHRFTLDLELRGAGAVASATHALQTVDGSDSTGGTGRNDAAGEAGGRGEAGGTAETGGAERVRVRLRDGEVVPDRDLVLSWRPRQEANRSALAAWLHDDAAAGHAYFLALVAPPLARRPDDRVGREVILLVDHSGSMEGPKWEAADWAVKQFLAGLGEGDCFNLGLFHSTTRWFARAPQAAAPAAVQRAIRFLEEHRDSGGTELGVALEQALAFERMRGQAARHVLVITDAEVSDAGRILRLADQEWARPDRRRISVLCSDAAPNSFLAAELAARGGGVARFLTSAPEEEDVTTALDEVLLDWSQPALAGLRLEVDRPEVQAAGRRTLEVSGRGAIDLGDLPAGRTLWVTGRVPRDAGGGLALRLVTGSEYEVARCRLDPAAASGLTGGDAEAGAGPRDTGGAGGARDTTDAPGSERDGSEPADATAAIKALFGARRVLGLEYLVHAGYGAAELGEQLERLGYDAATVAGVVAGQAGGQPKVYAENARRDAEAALRELLVREALDYGLASAETAFVAVRTERGRPVEGTVAVANALPAGWSPAFLAAGLAGGTVAAFALAAPTAAPMPAAMPPGTPVGRAGGLGAFFKRASRAVDAVHVMRTAVLREAPAGERAGAPRAVLFSGVPQFTGQEAIIFDSRAGDQANRLPEAATLARLRLRFPAGASAPEALDPGIVLLLFVDDLAAPRARVRLADLVRQGGERPLNIRRLSGQPVRLVLIDPAGAWGAGAPPIEVTMEWAPFTAPPGIHRL